MIMAWARQLAERETIQLTHPHPGLRCEVNATSPSRVAYPCTTRPIPIGNFPGAAEFLALTAKFLSEKPVPLFHFKKP